MIEKRLLQLLEVVIENYIEKWEPIGSKFLNNLEDLDYAPSTLRKYLNILEWEGYLYQPYHSAWRLPTVKGLSSYIENIIEEEKFSMEPTDFNIKFARNSLRFIVEGLGSHVTWAVVGFLRNDEYYFLGIDNLLSEDMMREYETFKYLINFIENKKIIKHLNSKMAKQNKINYSFIKNDDKIISNLYVKITVNWYEGFISVLGPVRINYKRNLSVLKQFININKS